MKTRFRHLALSFLLVAASVAPANAGFFELLEVAADPGIPDTVRLESSTAPQGSQLVLPIHFYCDEELGGIQVVLGFDPVELVCDSVSFVGSSITLGGGLSTVDSAAGTINAAVIYVSQDLIPPQTGVFGYVYFSQLGAPHGAIYNFDSTSIQVDTITLVKTVFSTSNPATSIFPRVVAGSIEVTEFLPGDANNDGKISIGDVTFLIARIFSGGPAPVYPAAADADASCTVGIGDVTFLIARIFTGGEAPRLGCAQ